MKCGCPRTRTCFSKMLWIVTARWAMHRYVGVTCRHLDWLARGNDQIALLMVLCRDKGVFVELPPHAFSDSLSRCYKSEDRFARIKHQSSTFGGKYTMIMLYCVIKIANTRLPQVSWLLYYWFNLMSSTTYKIKPNGTAVTFKRCLCGIPPQKKGLVWSFVIFNMMSVKTKEGK